MGLCVADSSFMRNLPQFVGHIEQETGPPGSGAPKACVAIPKDKQDAVYKLSVDDPNGMSGKWNPIGTEMWARVRRYSSHVSGALRAVGAL